ncbi:MAG: exodeoxyribonuclease VII large subunit [Desulfobulbaceae bacterium]|nr:exodeoxyribonuclease VII large subunit [Desulfobulbaceae bacterium]
MLSTPTSFLSRVQTVTEITRSIKVILESGFAFVSVCGEVSNLKKPYSGHLYFTLKDHDAQIKAVLFKTQRRYLPEEFADGHQVVCRGRISVYEPRGDYQLVVDSVEFAGAGGRQAAYERLKEKLYQEGLFAEGHKRKLPLLPKGIALITSPRGAAVHDFLTVAARRFPSIPIEIHPVSVQGESAAVDIIKAINVAIERDRADVIVVCRGGGSAEDLWPFNSEELARTVYRSSIPIVSAIGHEVDFTILDFVADHRAPTPTAAAEVVLPEQSYLQQQVWRHRLRQQSILREKVAVYSHRLSLQNRLLGNPTNAVETFRMRLDYLLSRLQRSIDRQVAGNRQRVEAQRVVIDHHAPRQSVERYAGRVTHLRQRLIALSQRHLERKTAAVQQCSALIRSFSPLAVLERGYAIVQRDQGEKIVRSSGETTEGDRLGIRLHEGSLLCEVIKTLPR